MSNFAGDGEGFEDFYKAEHPRLLALLTIAIGDVDLAAEACTEGFVRAWERWNRLAPEEPAGWVYRVGLNVARRAARRRALERRLLRHQPLPEPQAGPDGFDPGLWAALRELTFRQRTALALRHLLDLPQSEVAVLMGVRPGTVGATVAAARRRLAELYDDPRVERTDPEEEVIDDGPGFGLSTVD